MQAHLDPHDLARYTSSLRRDELGIWQAAGEAAVSYPEHGHDACFAVEESSFWFRHRNKVIVQALKRWAPGGPLFDIGGGNGCVSQALNQAGYATVLVEPGPLGARHARGRGLPCVVRATTQTAGFKPASLPAVGLFDVIEHIQDDLAFARDMHRLLVPGGLLYATVPAYGWLWSGEDPAAGHFRRHTAASMGRLLAGAGFETVYLCYFFRWLPLPLLLARALPWRLGLSPRVAPPARPTLQHAAGAPRLAALVERLFAGELAHVAAGRSMAFGASLLAVARRPSQTSRVNP